MVLPEHFRALVDALHCSSDVAVVGAVDGLTLDLIARGLSVWPVVPGGASLPVPSAFASSGRSARIRMLSSIGLAPIGPAPTGFARTGPAPTGPAPSGPSSSAGPPPHGRPVFEHLLSVPPEVDLAVFAVPPPVTFQILREIAGIFEPAVWLEPGSFDDGVLDFAHHVFEHVVAGQCILQAIPEAPAAMDALEPRRADSRRLIRPRRSLPS